MKKGMTLLIAALLCVIACCALADDDWGKAVVDAPSGKLHLRENPTSESDSLGLYFTGTQVTCESDPDQEWVEVKIGRERGYMYSKYLKTGSSADRVEPRFLAGTVNATNYARLRKGPSTEYQFICKINNGQNVTVMGETDEHWYYVKYGNEKGFISKNLVYTRGDATSSSAPAYTAAPVYTAAPAVSWRTAYRNWLSKNGDAYNTYGLIYVNDDDIPELAVNTGGEAGGCQILTYANGVVDVLQTSRLNFTYIKRGNRLNNSAGHMDSYYDIVYEIRNGKWMCIASGEYYGYKDGWNEILGRYICQNYVWNGQMTTLGEYMASLSRVYNEMQAQDAHFVYTHEDMMNLLKY